jgi:integrase
MSGFGTPISRADLITRSFKPLLLKAGLPDIRFYDLRHTCATLLLGRGVHTKLVQELLGHSSVAVILDTYSHVLPVMDDGLADRMGAALGLRVAVKRSRYYAGASSFSSREFCVSPA